MYSPAFDQSHMAQEVNSVAGLATDKRLVGALDSACNRTCTGPDWLSSFLKCLRSSAPPSISSLVKVEDENETFRFGNGGTQQSFQRWRLPTMIGGEVVCFWTSVVQVPSLGLLLGRDFLEAVGAVMNFGRKSLRCELLDDNSIKLSQPAAGHYALGLLPSAWPSLEPQRWRRLGLDGVIEIQLSTTSWLKKRLNQSLLCRTPRVDGHEHFLTESSMRAGHLVCSVLSARSFGDQAASRMNRQPPVNPTPTTSSILPDRLRGP